MYFKYDIIMQFIF